MYTSCRYMHWLVALTPLAPCPCCSADSPASATDPSRVLDTSAGLAAAAALALMSSDDDEEFFDALS
jgi:hypothetical protein